MNAEEVRAYIAGARKMLRVASETARLLEAGPEADSERIKGMVAALRTLACEGATALPPDPEPDEEPETDAWPT